MVDKNQKTNPINITIKTDTVLGSSYAQMIGVVVTDNDFTLEFAYLNPRPGNKEAHVVSRVTLPRAAAEGLVNTILTTTKEHEAKKKGGNKNGLRNSN
ncbi:MAG: DUF3467 domain-containing protein [Patescibacteria group bacterium]